MEQPLPKNFACVSGDTIITTPDGVRKISSLVNSTNNELLSTNGKIEKYFKVISSGTKQTFSVELSNGLKINATGDHKFMIDGKQIETKDLKIGMNCEVITNYPFTKYGDNNEFYEMLGWMVGDGWYSKQAVGISFNNKDGDFPHKNRLLPIFKSTFHAENIKPLKDDNVSYQIQVTDNSNAIDICEKLGLYSGHATEKRLPKTFYDWSILNQISFIRGLFAADGSVQGKNRGQIYLYSNSVCLIEEVQEFLSSIGIHSRLFKTPFKSCKRNTQYRCCISKNSSCIFMDIIGFNGHKKGERYVCSRFSDEKTFKIKSITPNKIEEVFDVLEVNNTNTFYANGIAVHNCNLGSLNLTQFIINPFTERAHIDMKALEKAVDVAVKNLDILIDENINNHPLEEQRINSSNYRNIGLGMFGYASALMMLGITYGSDESKKFTDSLFANMFRWALISSNKIAKNKGKFPKYKDCVLDSSIVKEHFTDDEIKELKIDGLRNCSLLSIAPTGTLSTMMELSGGVEPEYSIKYTRKTESLNNNQESYYDVYCKTYADYRRITGNDDMPKYFVTSQEINWKDRVDIQGIMQRHIDTAISSTVNLRNETEIDDIEKLYLYAWENGLKGITVFRDGCKKLGILTTEKSKEEKAVKTEKETVQNIPRGIIVDIDDDVIGKKRKLITGCGSLHCVAFFDPINGDLLETYLSKGSTGGCNNFMIGLSRMISLSARAGCDIQAIINQLDSCGVCPSYAVRSATKHDTSKGSCCPTAIGKALLSMYNEVIEEMGLNGQEEEKNTLKTGNECPECGESLIFEGGCNVCKSCGWSKCG